MSRPEHQSLPTTPTEYSDGYWQHQLWARCHKRHEGAHLDCILFWVYYFTPQMFDRISRTLADMIHLARHPLCGIRPKSDWDMPWIVFAYESEYAKQEIIDLGGRVEDITWEFTRAWVPFNKEES